MVDKFEAEMYFKWGKIKDALFFATFALVFLAVIAFWNNNWAYGIIVLIIIGVLEIIEKKLFPSDSEIDDSFKELAQKRVKESLDKLGLEDSDIIREPLIITGVGNYTHSKQGSDEVWRFNPMVVEIIHFGKNQLLTNTVQLDLINQDNYSGKTNEFFYKDITAVSIEDSKNNNGTSKQFVIKVHGQVELNTGIQSNQESIAEDAVKTIRKTLREKKQD